MFIRSKFRKIVATILNIDDEVENDTTIHLEAVTRKINYHVYNVFTNFKFRSRRQHNEFLVQ